MSNATAVADQPAAVETPRAAKDYKAILDYDALRWHATTIAKNEYQAVFKAIALMPSGDMVSSDGFHLAISSGAVTWPEGTPEKPVLIAGVPRRLPIGNRGSSAVLEDGIIRTADNKLYAVTYNDGNYPDYERIIPDMKPDSRTSTNFTAIDIPAVAAAIERMPGLGGSHPILEYFGTNMAVIKSGSHTYYRATLRPAEGSEQTITKPGEVFTPKGWTAPTMPAEELHKRMERCLKLDALVQDKPRLPHDQEQVDVIMMHWNTAAPELISERMLRRFENILMDALAKD